MSDFFCTFAVALYARNRVRQSDNENNKIQNTMEELNQQVEQQEKYDGSSIQVLEGLEAVRKRPAMYIGDISLKGLHHLVYEVVDNSIDEALAGFCSNIEVTINEDNSITVQDNGRGIPVDMHPKEKKSALEVVMTVLHAGGKFNKDSYKVSGGLHGVGVSCVNALSTKLHVEVRRDGKIHAQDYATGKPLAPVSVIGTYGEGEGTGTRVQFWPDGSIFTETVYKYEILANRMRELAYLNAGVRISLTDKREKNEDGSFKGEIFYSENGLSEFVRYIDSNRTPLISEVIHLNTEKFGTPVEVAILYNTDFTENVYSYVNNINTIEGGTHETGFKAAMTRVINDYARKNNSLKEKDNKIENRIKRRSAKTNRRYDFYCKNHRCDSDSDRDKSDPVKDKHCSESGCNSFSSAESEINRIDMSKHYKKRCNIRKVKVHLKIFSDFSGNENNYRAF